MSRVLIFSLALIVLGGCGSNAVNSQNVQNKEAMQNQSGIEEKIYAHLKANASLDKDQVAVKELAPGDLPSGVRQFYVEKKGSYGTQRMNYFVYKDDLYSSIKDGDLERFLKALHFIPQQSLTAKQLWRLYDGLASKGSDAMLVTEEIIAKPYDQLKPFVGVLQAPEIKYSTNEATMTFFMYNSDAGNVKKNILTVRDGYKVTVDSSDLKK